MTDFGADDPFAAASAKLKEHYGIEVPVSTIRAITEKHGEAMLALERTQASDLPEEAGVAVLITEIDGSMVPMVETAEPVEAELPLDRRKTRKLSWTEARLCLAHVPGSVTPVFGATMGSTDDARRPVVGMPPLPRNPEVRPPFHGLGQWGVVELPTKWI